ncbi:MAG TPA: response regulator [Saprospiraceae bacterium]|nr:response regulator [Saprospiraceae bacterium]HMP23755.1 response regulator [Saprospiraceae bacterium]
MKVLTCDAEPVLLAAIEFRLRKYGLEIIQTKRKDAHKAIEQHRPDMLIIDTESNPAASLKLLQEVKTNARNAFPVIIASVIEDEEELWAALRAGAEDFITKPFKPIELVLRVRRLLNALELKKVDGGMGK